ncbi:unnamed protein product [Effrenium voratum]|uniref:Uncharacterized protein n=1 Tax=Effrenium voratum TaxID=2562239 RepID=A0AA36HUK7_9DINO|nr:unnamed protein product [Effrenium voratum]
MTSDLVCLGVSDTFPACMVEALDTRHGTDDISSLSILSPVDTGEASAYTSRTMPTHAAGGKSTLPASKPNSVQRLPQEVSEVAGKAGSHTSRATATQAAVGKKSPPSKPPQEVSAVAGKAGLRTSRATATRAVGTSSPPSKPPQEVSAVAGKAGSRTSRTTATRAAVGTSSPPSKPPQEASAVAGKAGSRTSRTTATRAVGTSSPPSKPPQEVSVVGGKARSPTFRATATRAAIGKSSPPASKPPQEVFAVAGKARSPTSRASATRAANGKSSPPASKPPQEVSAVAGKARSPISRASATHAAVGKSSPQASSPSRGQSHPADGGYPAHVGVQTVARAIPRAIRSSKYDASPKMEEVNLLRFPGLQGALAEYAAGASGPKSLARAVIAALFDAEFRGSKRWEVNAACATEAPDRKDVFQCEKSAEYDWKDISSVASAKALIHVTPELISIHDYSYYVQRLASCTRGQAMVAPLKSYDRARAKVITRYGGDSSCITDVMRASIVYPTIAEVYSALKFILKEDRQQPRADLKVMEVNDRFQFGDGYRDLTLLFEMSGVIVEVQMQIKGIQDVKKSGGHKAYRVQREVNELIFEASVQNSEEDVVELVKAYSVSGQGTKDKNGRSALHYSLHHGALRASRALLAAGSDPWLEDDHGVLGFELSLKNKAWAALELVLSAMLRKGPRTRSRLARLAQNVPWWCANVVRLQSGDDLLRWREAGRLLVMVLRHYEALQLLEPYLLELAQTGDSKALRALIGAGADQVLSPGAESLLDYAIKSGQVEMVKMLVCMQLGDGTPFCAHCFKESPHVHLKIAAKLQDVAYAKAALVAGADPRSMDSRNVGKRTALMSFAFAGELGLCEELVEAKAEVQWIDGSCCNAIHYALALKQDEVAQYLRDLRVVTEVPLKHGSPKDVVQYLLKAAQEGCCGAIYRGQESLRSLQFSKIDTGQWKEALRERFGPSKWTLLHYAVKVLRSADPAGQVCRALLAAKADPRLADADGETPLHWAAAGGHAKAYEQLVQAAYRLEAEHRGPAAEPLEPLLQETQKALRRQLLRDTQGTAAKEVADDDAKWLQAGLLAFKHAVLFRRLVGESQEPRVAAPKRVMKKKTTTVSRGLRRRPSGDFNSPGSSQKTLRCQKTLSESSGARIALVPDGGSSSSRRPSSSPMSRPASASSEKKTRIGFTDKPDK